MEFSPLPFEPSPFDVVFCTEVLEHLLGSPQRMFGSIHRAIRPGGLLVLATFNATSSDRAEDARRVRIPIWCLLVSQRHTYEYTHWEVSEMLQRFGLIIRLHTIEDMSEPLVGPYASVGEGCIIKRSAIERSVLLEGARVEGEVKLADSILGRFAQVRCLTPDPRIVKLMVGDDAEVVL